MGLVPGFPLPVFLLLAAVFAAASSVNAAVPGGQTGSRRNADANVGAAGAAQPPKEAVPAEALPIVLFLAPKLAHAIDQEDLQKHIARLSALVSADLGITIPRVPVQLDEHLPGTQFKLDVEACRSNEMLLSRRSSLSPTHWRTLN